MRVARSRSAARRGSGSRPCWIACGGARPTSITGCSPRPEARVRPGGPSLGWMSCWRRSATPSARSLLLRHGPDLTAEAREVILTLASGNPLGLVELPKAWRRGPASSDVVGGATVPLTAPLVDAFAAGLDDLVGPARDVLLVMAVAGEESTAELLDAAAVLSAGPVAARVLDEAVSSGLVAFERHQL